MIFSKSLHLIVDGAHPAPVLAVALAQAGVFVSFGVTESAVDASVVVELTLSP